MKLFFSSIFVIAGTASLAGAQSMPGEALVFLDGDGNRQITAQEMREKMEVLFPGMDTNDNGRLDYSEVETFMSREIFDDADANGNGTISKGEYMDQVDEDFGSADVDGDGVLD